MQDKPLPLGSRIFVALLCAVVLWLWYSFIRFRPDDVRDYSTVTGTLVSAEEQISYGKIRTVHLEIRLQEIAVRYLVPSDAYPDYFQREAFFAEISRGATVQLTALASDIAKPRTPLLDWTPTVFVRGVRASGRDYCVVQNYIAWQRKNNWYKLGTAIVGTGLLTFGFVRIRFVRTRRQQEAEGADKIGAAQQ